MLSRRDHSFSLKKKFVVRVVALDRLGGLTEA